MTPESAVRSVALVASLVATDPDEARQRMLDDIERWKEFLARVDLSFE